MDSQPQPNRTPREVLAAFHHAMVDKSADGLADRTLSTPSTSSRF